MTTGYRHGARAHLIGLLLISGWILLSGSITLAQNQIYWSAYDGDAETGRLLKSNPDGSSLAVLIPADVSWSFDLDPVRGKLYFVSVNDDTETSRIDRVNLDGSGRETVVAGAEHMPVTLGLDPIGGKVYWGDFYDDADGNTVARIKRANLDGSGIETIVGADLEWPWDIVIDPVAGKVYWGDVELGIFEEDKGKLERANLDGSGRETLSQLNSGSMLGIALDVAAGKMYWTENTPAGGSIKRANLDGSAPETILSRGLVFQLAVALDLAAGKIYWSEAENDPDIGKIHRANLDGTGIETLWTSDSEVAFGLAFGPGSETPVAADQDFLPKSDGISFYNYPNPFHNQTSIEYRLTDSGHVTLAVYDLLGRQVKTLVDTIKPAGNHRVLFNAGNLPPGAYMSILTTGPRRQTNVLMVE